MIAANIRVRRSRRDSTLLQSPARAGHASRMRQIFENAARDQVELQSTSSSLYPQLANVSRKASPPPITYPVKRETRQQSITHDLPIYRMESLYLSTDPTSAAALTGEACASPEQPSEHPSGSWSDDTGYIVTVDSRIRDSSFALATNEQVHAWLRDLPDWKELDVDENRQTVSVFLMQNSNGVSYLDDRDEVPTFSGDQKSGHGSLPSHPISFSISDKGSLMLSRSDTQGPDTAFNMPEHGYSRQVSSDCSQLCFNDFNEVRTPPPQVHPSTSLQYHNYLPDVRKGPSNLKTLDEGDMQVSPLSPNVCIERGPARHHSNRKPRGITTPRRDSPAIHFRAPQLKENVLVNIEGGSSCNGSPTHRSNRVNRRYWQT
jgi:hypothetical protein